MNNQDIINTRKLYWSEYLEEVAADAERVKEVETCQMSVKGSDGQEISMKYGMKITGEPDPSGYPLYIALHGGGQGDTPDLNNQQWEHMGIYYFNSVSKGIYVNPRGIRDTWDCHGNPESYYFYDRLITNLVALKNVDPNRVYLLGFSAGGDGVYMITPKMADRFAAVHMSAGHPNGISLINLFNTPIQLQVGMNDDAFGRNHETVRYAQYLDRLQKRNCETSIFAEKEKQTYYRHRCFVHIDKPHNFVDYGNEDQKVIQDNNKWLETGEVQETMADTNAIHFLEKYTRNPMPEHVIWDLSCREEYRIWDSFYWLWAPETLKEGIIDVTIKTESNEVIISKESSVFKGFSVLVNEQLLDISKPIKIIYPEGKTEEREVSFSEELLKNTLKKSGDYNYSFIAKIDI